MEASPPGIPPPRSTTPAKVLTFENRRFKRLKLCGYTRNEFVEDYRPGGYHPVVIGDIFKDQYKVIRKLGYGYFATVWLAHDLKNNRYVALKISVSVTLGTTMETQVFNHINEVTAEEANKHVTLLLDEFEHQGPNGTHKCLVLEPMVQDLDFIHGKFFERILEPLGPDKNYRREEILESLPRMGRFPHPLSVAKRILKQSLQALAFLYENGIVYGNLHPGNILISPIEEFSPETHPENVLQQEDDSKGEAVSISGPVQRLDGKEDKWAPPYVCTIQPLLKFGPFKLPSASAKDYNVKLGSMSTAYLLDNPPAKSRFPRGYQAPELVFTEPGTSASVTSATDMWSFGCLIYALVTCTELFLFSESIEILDKYDHEGAFRDRIGPLPEIYSRYALPPLQTPKVRMINPGQEQEQDTEDESEMTMDVPAELWEWTNDLLKKRPEEGKSMEELFDLVGPHKGLGDEEAEEVKKLIRWILNYDPAKRPSPAEVLRHPWFVAIDLEGDSQEEPAAQ